MSIITFVTAQGQIVNKFSEDVGYENTRFNNGSGWAREAIEVPETSAPDSERTFWLPTGVTIPDSFWLSWRYKGPSSYSSDCLLFDITDGTNSLLKAVSGSDETLSFYWYDGTSDVLLFTVDDVDYTITSLNDFSRIDIEFVADASGEVNLYYNRDLAYTYTGDTSTGTVIPDRITFEDVSPSSSSSFANTTYIHSFFIADEDSTLIEMYQHEIAGSGSLYTDLTGSYENLSSIGTINDETSVVSSESGDTGTYLFDDVQDYFSGGDVVAVGLFNRIKNSNDWGGDQFRFLTATALNTQYSDYYEMDQYVSPNTVVFNSSASGGAWDITTLVDQEFGVEVSENG